MKPGVQRSGNTFSASSTSEPSKLSKRLEYIESITHLGCWEYDLTSRHFYWSAELYKLLSVDPLSGEPDLQNLIKHLRTEDGAEFTAAFAALSRGELPDVHKLRTNGEFAPERILMPGYSTEMDPAGHPAKLLGTFQDITDIEQKDARILRLNRLYATVSHINQIIIQVHDKDALFEQICQEAIRQGRFRMAWVGLIDESSGLVKPEVFVGEENDYLKNIKISMNDNVLGMGPIGRAIRENRVQICQDIAADPNMAPWRTLALQHGFRSSAAVPISRNNHAIGAFAVYAAETQSFTQVDESLLTEIGQNISFVLDSLDAEKNRQDAEEALRKSENLLYTAFHFNPIPITFTDLATEKWIEVNEAFLKVTGYTREELIGHTYKELNFWVHPELREIMKEKLLRQGHIVDQEIEINKKNGSLGVMQISVEPVNLRGSPCILIMGKEVTESKKNEKELQFRNTLLIAQQEASIDGILVVDEKDQIISYNHRLVEIWKIPENILADKKDPPLLQYVTLQVVDPKQFISRTKYLYDHQRETSQDEINLLDGRCFERYSAPIYDSQDHYHGRVWYFHDITKRKLTEREIRLQSENLQLINTLNQAANRGENMQEILDDLVRENKNIFSSLDAALLLLSPDEKNLVLQNSTFGPSKNITDKLEKLLGISLPQLIIPVDKDSYFYKQFQAEEGILISDPAKIDEWLRAFTQSIAIPPVTRVFISKVIPQIRKIAAISSVIMVPLISSGKVIGLLATTSKTLLTQEDLTRIRYISSQITTTILHRQAGDRVRVQLKRINTLNEIERAINASLDLHLTLDILVKKVHTQLEIDAASILLLNQYNHTLELFTNAGFEAHPSVVHFGHGLAGRVAMERKTIYLPDLSLVEDKSDIDKSVESEKFVEYIGVPLISKGSLKGVLSIFNRSRFLPDSDWMNYLEMLGSEAAIAIDNAQSFEELQTSNRELITAYDATITGWSLAMDLRDKESEGHTQRVTALALRLAEKLGINRADQINIRRGALLHDIGKLGVPDSILLKAEPLTTADWEILHQHPIFAFNMLSGIDYLHSAMDIPYCHHENWDGTGYPRGLKGEEIPLAARLFSIGEVWDILSHGRPYRLAWKREDVIAYIKEQSGKKFDPRIVELFLKEIVGEQ